MNEDEKRVLDEVDAILSLYAEGKPRSTFAYDILNRLREARHPTPKRPTAKDLLTVFSDSFEKNGNCSAASTAAQMVHYIKSALARSKHYSVPCDVTLRGDLPHYEAQK